MNPLLQKAAVKTSFFETDGYLYHGTTTRDLESILKDGKVDGISFWGVKDMADMYEGGAMLRVPVSRFNQAFLLPDENMINDPYFIEDENGDYDSKKMNAVNRAWKTSKKTWQDSLKIWGAVMYDEDLPVTQADVLEGQPVVSSKTAADVGTVKSVIAEMMPVLKAGLPQPEVKIVNQVNRMLGQTIWQWGRTAQGQTFGGENTVMEIQKRVLADETTLRRIIAHELCHHEVQLLVARPKLMELGYETYKRYGNIFGPDGHGKEWKEVASRFNAKYGADYVTETSDQDYIYDTTEDKEIFVLINNLVYGHNKKRLGWEWAVKLSPKAKAFLNSIDWNSDEYKLVKTTDHMFTRGRAKIQQFGGWNLARTPEQEQKLQELWANAPQTKIAAAGDAYFRLVPYPFGTQIQIWDPKLNYAVGSLYLRDDDYTEGMVFVEDVAVNIKREGYGYKLYQKAIEVAKEKGKTKFSQGTPQTPEARMVWEKLKRQYPVENSEFGYFIPLDQSKTAADESDYQADYNKVREERVKTYAKFIELAEEQRGEPEMAMLRIQNDPLGAGVYSFAVEHTGDLTHRMNEQTSIIWGNFGYEMVQNKVEKVLRYMESGYGFEREMQGNLRNNYEALLDTKLKGVSFEQALSNFRKKCDAYANAHAALKVYNRTQENARDAAVALGRWDFATAKQKLRNLKVALDAGPEYWVEVAKQGVPVEKTAKTGPHKNSTTQINLPPDAAAGMMAAAEQIPDAELGVDGREDDPHITVKYGVRNDPALLSQIVADQQAFNVTLGKTHVFEVSASSAAQAPVVVECHAPELAVLHNKVMEAMGTRPDDFPYVPHVTLAYVKPEEAAKYEGMNWAEGISFQVDNICLSTKGGHRVVVPFKKPMKTGSTDSDWETIKQNFLSGVVYHGTTAEIAQIIQTEGFRGLEFDEIVNEVLGKYDRTLDELPKKRQIAIKRLGDSYKNEHHLVSTSPAGETATRFAGQGGEVAAQIESYALGVYSTRDVKKSRISGEPAVVVARIKNFQNSEHFARAKQIVEGWQSMIGEESSGGKPWTPADAAADVWSLYINFLCKPEDLEVIGTLKGAEVEQLKQGPVSMKLSKGAKKADWDKGEAQSFVDKFKALGIDVQIVGSVAKKGRGRDLDLLVKTPISQEELIAKTESLGTKDGPGIQFINQSVLGPDEAAKQKKPYYEGWSKILTFTAGADDTLELWLTEEFEKSASHKTPPMSDTHYRNPEMGEESNAYADIPERVDGTADLPPLEDLSPDLFKTGGQNFNPLPFDNWCDANPMYQPDDFNEAEWRYDENVEHFSTLKFPVTIYRAVEVEKGTQPNLEKAGIYWTWVENSADAYFGKGSMWDQGGPHPKNPQTVIIKAQVLRSTDVDWDATILANMLNEEENEVTIKSGTQLRLIGIDYGEGYKKQKSKTITAKVAYADASTMTSQVGQKGVGGQDFPDLEEEPMFSDEKTAAGTSLLPDEVDMVKDLGVSGENGRSTPKMEREPLFPEDKEEKTAAGTPRYLYHGTEKKNLDDILKNGLRVEFNESNIEWQKATYLACDAYTAANYAGHKGAKPEDWVVLRIAVNKLREHLLRPDDYDFPDMWGRESMHEEVNAEIKPLKEEYGDNWADVPWEVSLQVCCQVAYLGDIPPDAITVMQPQKTSSMKFADVHSYYEGLDQAADSILNEFEQHIKDPKYRQKWEVVPAARMKKIWNDYAKTSMVRDEKGMDDIAWTVLYNIWKIHANTILCGHTDQNPYDFAESVTGENFLEKYGKDKWENGCFDWDNSFFEDDNGSWRLTDFALNKLIDAAGRLEAAATAEQKLQAVDRVLNIVHARSDLASWFVQGGTSTLNSLAGYEKHKEGSSFPSFNAWVKKNGGIAKLLDSYDVDTAETYGYGLEEPENPAAVKRYERELHKRALADFQDRYETLIAEYESWQFPMDVFRCISLPKNPNPPQQHLFPGTPQAEYQQALEAIQYKGVGIYWSWDENSAECHWGTGGASVTLHGVINKNNIDWEGTIYANMFPTLGDAEKEVRLIEGTQFELEGIQYDEKAGWSQPPVRTVTASAEKKVRYYYHATKAENLNSIAKHGLKPSEDPQWGGDLGATSYGKVFFASNPRTAMYYAMIVFHDTLEAYQHASIPVCLRVRVPENIPVVTGTPSDKTYDKSVPVAPGEEFGEAWATQVIPPENIEVFWHTWEPLKAGHWDEMEVRWREPEDWEIEESAEHGEVEVNGYYEDWEGDIIGDTVSETVDDIEQSVMPKTAKSQTTGEVYLLHFNIKPGEDVPSSREDATNKFHARHYLGWAENAQERIEQHYKATSGVKLIEAIHAKGITFTVAKIWTGVDRNFERRLKNQGGLGRHCPICRQLGIDRDTLRKKKLKEQQVAPATPEAGPDFVEKTSKFAMAATNLADLRGYLTMSREQMGEELARSYPGHFRDFLEENYPEVLEKIPEDEEEYLDDFSVVPPVVLDDFLEKGSYWALENDPANAPTFLTVDYRRDVKNKWLVHFTDYPEAIAKEGFKYGMDRVETLALTTYFKDEAKKFGGYNFAMDPDNRNLESLGAGYGKHCVIFQASGIVTWHTGDEFEQIIFWGKDARNIIPIMHYNDQWNIGEDADGNPLFSSYDLSECIDYGIANAATLVPKKAPKQKARPATAALTPNDRVFYHGTNKAGDFTELSAEPGGGIIWLAEKEDAESYAHQHYRKGEGRIFKVTLKPNAKIIDLRDLTEPLVQQIKKNVDAWRGVRGYPPMTDEEFVKHYTDYGVLEGNINNVDLLKNGGVDGVICNDVYSGSKRGKHVSLALFNPNAIQSQSVEPASKTAAEPWEMRQDEYAGRWNEQETEEQGKVRHEKNQVWEQNALAALSLGKITPEQAKERGVYEAKNFKPLPQTPLYHVTTAKSRVEAEGLKTRYELGQSYGKGLGGGTSMSISFTDDYKIAQGIYENLLIARKVAAGEMTLDDMIDTATKGEGADRPWINDILKSLGGSNPNDKINVELDAIKRGVAFEHGMGRPPDDPAILPQYRKPGPWRPTPWSQHWKGGDGEEKYTYWERDLTPKEKQERVFEFFKKWSFWREQAGGGLDPLYFMSDPAGLAQVPESEIAIMEFKALPGAMGTVESALGEWRVYTGAAVQLVGKANAAHAASLVRTSSDFVKFAFFIEVPEESRGHFWDEPPAHNLEFWAFKGRPAALPNEKVYFTFDKMPVAETTVLKIEKPGESKCELSGKYENHWKLYWEPAKFVKYAGHTAPTLYHGTCPENAEAILKNGWQPNQISQGGNMGQTKYLYLSTHPEDARWFANEKGCDTVLAIRNVPMSSLMVDPEDGTHDTLEEELSSELGLPGKVVVTKSLDKSHFTIYQPKTAALPKKWYHGTSKKNAEKIMKDGWLRPDQETIYDIDIPRDGAVYIAEFDIANQYAIERSRDGVQGVILEVAAPDISKLLPDEDDVYELLNDRGGELNARGQRLSNRVKALWLQQWNEENASYNDPEKFPIYKNFEEAWAAWSEIEYEGSSELAEQMKYLTDYIVKKDKALARGIIESAGKAAHMGPLKVVKQLKTAAPKSIWYHGTSIKNLQPIMSQGLLPSGVKKVWESDPDASITAPSREAYGGIYVTQNLLTATGAPDNEEKQRLGGMLLVILELQPNTMYLDEDSITGALGSPIKHMSDNAYWVLLYYLASTQDGIRDDWREDVAGMQGDYIHKCLTQWESKFKERDMPFHPDLKKKLEELLPGVWVAAITRAASHVTDNLAYIKAWDQVFYGTPKEKQRPEMKDVVPSSAEGEKAFRTAAEQVTRTLRLLARPDADKDQSYNINTARINEPIGFSGSNRILALLEIRDTRKVRGEDFKAPVPMILHWGNIPPDFWVQWKQRHGSAYELIDARKGNQKPKTRGMSASVKDEIVVSQNPDGRIIAKHPQGVAMGTLEDRAGLSNWFDWNSLPKGDSGKYDKSFVLGHISVRVDARRTGLGRALVGALLDAAKAQGAEACFLTAFSLVGLSAKELDAFYTNVGFEHFYKDVYMRKLAGVAKFAAMNRISQQDAVDRKMFGPVYHGTTEDRQEQIGNEGFKIYIGDAGSGDVAHGYEGREAYHDGIPAPVHHLGYGVYFTTAKSIAKTFAGGTTRGMKTYYLDVPNLETINFGAPKTMMKWWISQGYDPQLAKTNRVEATKKLTENLKSKFDAVWYKGKGMYKLLDGDQICVFDTNRIYEVDPNMSKPGDIGSKVVRKADGMKGVIKGIRSIPPDVAQQYHGGADKFYEIKWTKGGTDHNVYARDIDFVGAKAQAATASKVAAFYCVACDGGDCVEHESLTAAVKGNINKLTFETEENDDEYGGWTIKAMAPDRMPRPYAQYEGPVGFINIGVEGASIDGPYVYDINVEDDWRGTGLGQQLYDLAIAEAKKRGYKEFNSSIDQTPEAKAAWKRISQRYPVTKKTDKVENLPYFSIKLAAEGFNEEGFWAGEGNAASGVLPICTTTHRICLAWRSPDVHIGDCWGTIGGAVKSGMSLAESAKAELKEETGFGGGVTMHPAYVFQSGSFSYHNFLGTVGSEFSFHPQSAHHWETTGLEWFTWEQIQQMVKEDSGSFHPGLISLFKANGKDIQRLVGSKAKGVTAGQTISGEVVAQHILDNSVRYGDSRPFLTDLREAYQLMGVDPETGANTRWELKSVPVDLLTPGDDYSPAVARQYADMDTPFPAIVMNSYPNGSVFSGTVLDGNHRAAAAKLRGDKTIEAYVPATAPKPPVKDTDPSTDELYEELKTGAGDDGDMPNMLQVFPERPDVIETFRYMRPFDRDALIEEASVKEISPAELKTNQQTVTRAAVEHFVTHPNEINKPQSNIGLSDTEQLLPLVLLTNDGYWLYDGNHRANAAMKLNMMLECKIVDLRDYEEPRSKTGARGEVGPVYHGTDKKFDKFEHRPGTRYILFKEFQVQAGGFFFTDDIEYAKEFGSNIVTCYLRMKKPLIREEDQYSLTKKQIKDLTYICEPCMSDHYTDMQGNTVKMIELGATATDVDETGAWLNEVVKPHGLDWNILDNQESVNRMKELGYDSTMVDEANGKYSYFVVSPEQIRVVNVKTASGTWKDEGLLNESDMKKWKRYWDGRGHSLQIDKVKGGLFHCWLKFEKKAKQYGPVYHGTYHEWSDKIQIDQYKIGKFFTSDPLVAQAYGSFVHECYLTINKPFTVDAKGSSYSSIPTPKAMKGWVHESMDTVDSDNIAEYAYKNGYDGVIIKNVSELHYPDVDADDYIVFKPNQVKRKGIVEPEISPYTANKYHKQELQRRWEAKSKEGATFAPLYHGTSNKFDVFRTRRIQYPGGGMSLGAYFTANPEVAKKFMHGPNAEMKKVELTLNNPLDLRGKDYHELPEVLPWLDDSSKWQCKQSHAGMYYVLELLNKKANLVPKLKKKGYDGIIFDDDVEGTTYVAFRPDQIKQASSDIVDSFTVLQYVRGLHEGYEDDGRITQYKEFELKEVPLSQIDAPWETSEDLIGNYSALTTPFPPIVLDHHNTVIDGTHRVAAAEDRGDKTIMAYVPYGDPESFPTEEEESENALRGLADVD